MNKRPFWCRSTTKICVWFGHQNSSGEISQFIWERSGERRKLRFRLLSPPVLQSVFIYFFFIPLRSSDTSRDGDNIEIIVDVESSAQCAAMCNEDDRCMAWSYEKNNCSLKDSMPLHAYRPDVISGKPGNNLNKGRHSLKCQSSLAFSLIRLRAGDDISYQIDCTDTRQSIWVVYWGCVSILSYKKNLTTIGSNN